MNMVSRSLEKMMLIAVGLSAAVIVGVPILLYSIDILNNTTQLATAQTFAESLHDFAYDIECGNATTTAIQLVVPDGVVVSANGNSLIVTFERGGYEPVVWTQNYQHQISLIAPGSPDIYLITAEVTGNYLEIIFIAQP